MTYAVQLATEEQNLIAQLLRKRIQELRNQLRENESLSQPCPPGKWRWADVTLDGYHRKSEEQLAADRARAKGRADMCRLELGRAQSALRRMEGKS
jgi:hypothetical protein